MARPPSHRTRFIAPILALIVSTGAAAAEHAGRVTATGVPVPGATVTVTRGDATLTTTTDLQGAYTLPDLEDGVWMIRVEMPGFAPLAREVTIAPGAEPVSWELTLLPFEAIVDGTLSAAAEPGGADPPGQPDTAAAAPGVGGDAGAGVAFQRPAVSATLVEAAPVDPAAVGPFGTQDGFLINGSLNNGAATPFAQSAAFGNNRRVVSRRPYNARVGLNVRQSSWDASPPTFGARLSTRPDYNNLNLSGTLSGPLRIPVLLPNGPLFTLTYQRSTDQQARTATARMPTALERRGDFSQTRDAFGNPVTIVDPETGQPFPGNVVPPGRISPQAAALLALYPAANVDGAGALNYQRALPSSSVRDSGSFAINSISLSRRDQLSARVQYQRTKAGRPNLFAFDDQARGSGVDATLGFTRRVSPFFIIRANNTFSRQVSETVPFFAHRTNISGEAGITGNEQSPLNWGPPGLTLATIASLTAGDYARTRTVANTSTGEVFWTRGRHSLTMGGEVRRTHLDLFSQENPRGSFFFGGDATGSDVADLLLGMPTTSRIAFGNADKYFRGTSYAAFVMDDYRVGPSLTVNLGLRWEYEAPFTELRGRLVNLDVAPDFSAASPVLAADPVGSITGREFASSLVRPDKTGVQPRIALAWRPLLGSSIVVRAGYGIYRNTGVYQSLARMLAQQPPLSYVASAENSPATPLTLADGFIASPSITPNTYAIDPDFRVSDAHVWQVSMQRDLPLSLTMSAGYVGTKGMNLVQQFLPNTYAPGSANPCASCPIGFAYVTSTGSSMHNAAQLELRRRLRGGLTATAQYTLSKGTDNASTFSGIVGRPAQDWLNLDAEHALSDEDQRHRLTLQVQYTTGIGSAGGAYLTGPIGALVKGWTLAGQLTVGSGRPLTPLYSTALPGTAINGTVRAALTGASIDEVPEGYYLNPLAYTIPSPGAWGDAPRNSVRGPREFSLDAGITRSFPVTNRLNIDWRITATNLLNRVTYNAVNTIVNSPQFGLPVNANDRRQIQTNIQVGF